METAGDKFRIIPSITVSKGMAIVVKDGEYVPIVRDGKKQVALKLIREIGEEYDTIHLIDLDNVTKNKVQVEVLKEGSEIVDIWYEGLISDSEEIFDPIMSGVAAVVVSTKGIDNLETVLECFELTPNILFEVDFNDGILSPSESLMKMDVEDMVHKVTSLGVENIIFTDFGSMKGASSHNKIDMRLIDRILKEKMNLYVGGNISLDSVDHLCEKGVKGAIIGISYFI